jgi:flavorubredoxin
MKLKEILEEKGVEKVAIADLAREDMHECVEDAFRYDRLVLAAASYDAGVFSPMEEFLHILKSKNYQKRTIAIIENGSWAPTAARTMKGLLEGMKEINIVEPVITVKSVMNEQNVTQMKELADVLVG